MEKWYWYLLPVVAGAGLVLGLTAMKKAKMKARVVHFPNRYGQTMDAQAASIAAGQLEALGYPTTIVLGQNIISDNTAYSTVPINKYGEDVAYVVFIGGPAVNPYYYSITSIKLSNVDIPFISSRQVIDARGKYIVVAGWEKEDTLQAAMRMREKVKVQE